MSDEKADIEIWSQEVPEGYKPVFLREKPKSRGKWAEAIHTVFFAIEESTCDWDEHVIKVLDDAYEYASAYGFDEMVQFIKTTHTRFFTHKSIAVRMNYIRSFVHEEFTRPRENYWTTPDEDGVLEDEKTEEDVC